MWINYNKGTFIPNGGTAKLPENCMKALHPILEKIADSPEARDHSASSNIYLKYPGQSTNKRIYIEDREMVQLIEDLFKAMLQDIQEGYAMGIDHGSNLLLGLQNGSLTMNDFEDAINRKTESVE